MRRTRQDPMDPAAAFARDDGGRRWVRRAEAVRDTVKHAARGIARSPGLSVGIVLAFALGIGANATMYETVERLLLRAPPHIEDPAGVRRLLVQRRPFDTDAYPQQEPRYMETIAFPDYQDFARTSGFAHVAAMASRDVTLGRGEAARQVRAVMVTANWWELLGVRPALGRFFRADEDVMGAAPTAVLSWSRWQSDYGGRADVIGSTIDFGYGAYTIVGVTPKGFTGVDLRPVDFFAPFMVAGGHMQGLEEWPDSRNWYWLQSIARLAPGVGLDAAQAEATSHHRTGRAESTGYDRDASVVAAPLLVAQGPNAPSEVAVARWLLGVAAVVLLIACLNVANLLLARMLRQRREISIRLALGISRGRLVAQIVAEGVLLGVIGGGAALLLALWGGTFVQKTLLPDVDWSGGPSTTVLLMVLALSVFAGLLSALVPAVQASRRDVSAGLRTASGGISRSTTRVRSTLSMVQAALSVILLVGAGLFVRSLDRIRSQDFGLELWQVAHVAPVFMQGSVEPDERWAPYEAAVARVRRVPGVAAASVVSGVPFWSMYANSLRAQGVDSIPRSGSGSATSNAVDAAYFSTLGIRVLEGRAFDERDAPTAARTAIVNASFARALWPDESAVGRCLFIGPAAENPPCSAIVGVVEDAVRGALVREDAEFQYYLPLAQRQIATRRPEAIMIRTAADAAMSDVLARVQREVLAVDPRIRWVRAQPLADMVASELRQWRLGATLFTLFGLLALLVAGIGMYSVLAFDVAQRVREIGLRSALGASHASIMRLVLSRAARITAAGVAVGAAVAVVLAPRLRDMLYQVDPRDPLTFAVVVLTLAGVSLVAAGVPAWRAARVDPNEALRAE